MKCRCAATHYDYIPLRRDVRRASETSLPTWIRISVIGRAQSGGPIEDIRDTCCTKLRPVRAARARSCTSSCSRTACQRLVCFADARAKQINRTARSHLAALLLPHVGGKTRALDIAQCVQRSASQGHSANIPSRILESPALSPA